MNEVKKKMFVDKRFYFKICNNNNKDVLEGRRTTVVIYTYLTI